MVVNFLTRGLNIYGEIGKITTNEGKPLYKIVGEIHNAKEHISLTSLTKAVKDKSKYKITGEQLKAVIFYLKWVSDVKFKINNPPDGTISDSFDEFIWIETLDNITNQTKIFFSSKAIDKIVCIINNAELHKGVFNKVLESTST